MNKAKIDLGRLREKAKALVASYPKYKVRYQGLGIEDVDRLI